MSNQKNGTMDFMKGLFIGGLAGAVAAILYAPKSGQETREELYKKSSGFRDDMEAKLQLAQKRAETFLEETENRITSIKKDAESAVAEVKDKAAELVNESKEVLNKERAGVKAAVSAGIKEYKKTKA